jgi:hypothetical protein
MEDTNAELLTAAAILRDQSFTLPNQAKILGENFLIFLHFERFRASAPL